MKGPLRWLSSVVLALALMLGVERASQAHPAGFTSVNRYVGVACERGRVHLAYLVDFAELPAYAEIEQLDADHDGNVSPPEQRAYLDRRVPPLVSAWTVEINGRRASLRVTGSSLEALPGERGLSTLRIAADVAAEIVPPLAFDGSTGDVVVHVIDPAFAERSGWREMAAEESADAMVVSGVRAAPADILAYSSAPPSGPPRVDEARFVFRARSERRDADVRSFASRPGAPVEVDPGLARWSSAIRRAAGRAGDTGAFSWLALALALALGAAHALSPGHGKALAAAYLVGRRARASQAFVFGGAVTAAHTVVVFLVGCLALTVERTLGSDRLLRGLEVVSAVVVVVLGAVQFTRRWREVTRDTGSAHEHAPVPDDSGEPGGGHGLRALVALGASSGLTPCPSALALLLSAIALHRYGFGLVLVLAFSLGVATTLTAAGLLVVMARRALDRFAVAAPILRWLPILSSMCVLLIGILLCASAWSPAMPRPW